MAKFNGQIGFAISTEVSPGVWDDVMVERKYIGDIISNTRTLQTSSEVNDNLNVSNKISIVADPFANENFFAIRYVIFMGTKWKVPNVSVEYPRLILTLGGVYNG